MSWIKDVKEELKALDISKKSLRNFGLLVGGIFLLIRILDLLFLTKSLWNYLSSWLEHLLFIFGLLLPNSLSSVYKVWMGLAFALGWIMSRVLLTIFFYFVITPIGFIAKVVGKDFWI